MTRPRKSAEDGHAPPAASLSPGETERLALLAACRILDTPAEQDFDDLTKLAALICDVPIALISLVDEDRQWFKSRVGVEAAETPRRLAFCAHAIMQPGEVMEVPDAALDPRFATNELVTGEPRICFYAGAPLVVEDGLAVGTLCVIDRKPRQLSPAQREALAALSRQAVSQIQLRRRNTDLIAAHARQEQFFNLPLDILCIVGIDGIFKQLNPAFGEALGYSTEEMLAAPFLSFVHPDDVPATRTEMEGLAQGRPTLKFENRYRHKDGTYRWLSWRCAPAADGLIYASARDISVRKATEARLQVLSERWRCILDSAAYSIIATDAEGLITEFNPASERMLGYRAEEMIGIATPAILHDHEEVVRRAAEFSRELGVELQPGFETFVAKSVRNLPNEHEWIFRRKDGSRFPVQLSITALRDAAGQITGFIGIAVDITDRKQAGAHLLESEKRFREAVEYSAIGMALVGLDGSWLKVNRAICAIVGRSEAELLGCTFQDITHPDDLEADLAKVSALLAGEIDHYQMEKRYLHQAGHIVWVLLAVTLVRDDAGQPAYFVSQIKDITAQREADQQLKASLREKETLLQEIHHRVKNNLQVVSSLLSLQAGYIRNEEMLAQFQECQGRIRSMALIHEKLYQSESLACVDLKEYFESLTRIVFHAYATQRNIRLELALEPVSTNIDTAVPLGLLVNELLTNALKYAYPAGREGKVRVVLRPEGGGEFTLLVEDDGVGLPPDFQLDRAPTLGIRLVGMFAKQLRARLTFDSRPGQTSFGIHCAGALAAAGTSLPR